MYMVKEPSRSRLICAVFLTLAIAASAHAELTPLKNTDMEEIWGSSGIRIAVQEVQIFHHIDYIRYCATPNNGYIEFQDFMMHGIGNPAKFNYDFGTPREQTYYYFGSYTNTLPPSGIITIDVAEPEVAPVADWPTYSFGTSDTIHRGMILTEVPVWRQELAYTIGNIRFSDPDYLNYTDPVNAPWLDLGSFTIGLIDMPRFFTYTSPPIGGSGFNYQHNFQMSIDGIGYAYNTGCDAIEISSIYLGESFADLTGDDPRFPSTWKPNQSTDFGEFQIGDLFGDISTGRYSNPAAFNVGECDFDGTGTVLGALQLTAPMYGSIRFENVDFNGTNFGPGAIDGMQVHRLELFLIP